MIASSRSDHPDLSISLKRIIHRFFEAWDPPAVWPVPNLRRLMASHTAKADMTRRIALALRMPRGGTIALAIIVGTKI